MELPEPELGVGDGRVVVVEVLVTVELDSGLGHVGTARADGTRSTPARRPEKLEINIAQQIRYCKQCSRIEQRRESEE